MQTRFRLNLYTFVAAVLLAALMVAACDRPITIVTPQGKVAYAANEVLLRVQALQKATIAAEASGAIPTAVARTIITCTVESAKVLGALPAGWGPTVVQLWGSAKMQIPLKYLNDPALAAAVAAVDLVLAVYLPPGGSL